MEDSNITTGRLRDVAPSLNTIETRVTHRFHSRRRFQFRNHPPTALHHLGKQWSRRDLIHNLIDANRPTLRKDQEIPLLSLRTRGPLVEEHHPENSDDQPSQLMRKEWNLSVKTTGSVDLLSSSSLHHLSNQRHRPGGKRFC